MNVIIFGNGIKPSLNLIEEEMKKSTILICADGGGNYLYEYKIVPNYLIGDFDSISKEALQFFKDNGCVVESYPKDKNYTDSELCFNKAVELKANKITMLGFTGSRIDHLLGNLGFLEKCNNLNIEGIIIDDNNKIYLTDKSCIIKREENKFFSLYAYSQNVEMLSIIHGKFPLNNYNLIKGDTRTISNEFLEEDVQITFCTGELLIIIATD